MDATSSLLSAPGRESDLQVTPCREPTISELLADPMTRILMKADHVDIPAFEHMLDAVAGRVRIGSRIATQPVVALKASAGVKSDPSLPDYLNWTCVDRPIGPDAEPFDCFHRQNRRMQNAQKLNAQYVECLFVFRRDRITVELIQESRVVPNFQVRELSLDIHFALHLRGFPQNRWN